MEGQEIMDLEFMDIDTSRVEYFSHDFPIVPDAGDVIVNGKKETFVVLYRQFYNMSAIKVWLRKEG